MRRFRFLTLAACLFVALSSFGCANKETDKSDPDPHYYKGANFAHKKSQKG